MDDDLTLATEWDRDHDDDQAEARERYARQAPREDGAQTALNFEARS